MEDDRAVGRAGGARLDTEWIRWWVRDHRATVAGIAAAVFAAAAAGAVGHRLITGPPPGATPPVEQRLPRTAGPVVATTAPVVVVHVSGAVRSPGVYQVAAGSRAADVVDAAGGLLPGARSEVVNLAAPVRDGDQIHVPLHGDPAPVGSRGAADGPVDVNRADAGELERLIGIGPALAAAIVEHRSRHGPFRTVDDLEAVPGIGPATVERLRSQARV